jgi:hypothetical protein
MLFPVLVEWLSIQEMPDMALVYLEDNTNDCLHCHQ